MTEAQIRHMVDRFLGWKLPENFSPDGGVQFDPIGNAGTAQEYRRQPFGTNLLDAAQAEAMIRHLVDGLPVETPDLPAGLQRGTFAADREAA